MICIRNTHIYLLKKVFRWMGGMYGKPQQAEPKQSSQANQNIILQLKRSHTPQRVDNQTAPSSQQLQKENSINKRIQTVVSQDKNQIVQGLSVQESLQEKLPISQPSKQKEEKYNRQQTKEPSKSVTEDSKVMVLKSQPLPQSSKQIETQMKQQLDPSSKSGKKQQAEIEVTQEKSSKLLRPNQLFEQKDEVDRKSQTINSQKPIVKNESEEIQAHGQRNRNSQINNIAALISQLEQQQRQLQVLFLQHIRSLLSMTQNQEKKVGEGSEMPANNLTIRRIQNQLKDIRKDPPVNWRVIQNPEKWNQWIVEVNAHDDTPFHSIPIYLIVKFPNNYPHSKPFIKLQSPHLFYHPNIWTSGVICQDKMKQQKPSTTVRERIEGFIFVLSHPNPKSPANNKAAAQYENNYRQYRKRAFKIFRQIKDKS